MAGDGEAAAFVGRGDEAEQQLTAGGVQWSEADLVDDQDVVAEDRFDEPTDAVVGVTAVEVLDQLGGGEVSDLAAGFDPSVSQGDQGVALARPGRPDQRDVLFCLDPLQ